MEKRVNFSVVKEKIIKTDELLNLYEDQKSKLCKLSYAYKEAKTKYETAVGEINRLRMENDRLNFNLEKIKPKFEQNELELFELKEDITKLEEKYQQTLMDSQSQYDSLKKSIDACTCDKDILSPKAKKSPSEIKAKEKLKEFKEKYKELNLNQNQLKKENAALVIKNKQYIEEFENDRKNHIKVVESLQTKNDFLQREISKLKLKVSSPELGHSKPDNDETANLELVITSLKCENEFEVKKLQKEVRRLSVEYGDLKKQRSPQKRDCQVQTEQKMTIEHSQCVRKIDFKDSTDNNPEISDNYLENDHAVEYSSDESEIYKEFCSHTLAFDKTVVKGITLSPMSSNSDIAGTLMSPINELTDLSNSIPNITVTPPTPVVCKSGEVIFNAFSPISKSSDTPEQVDTEISKPPLVIRQRRRKFIMPQQNNLIPLRKRRKISKKALLKKKLKARQSSDTILEALKALQALNISFTISNGTNIKNPLPTSVDTARNINEKINVETKNAAGNKPELVGCFNVKNESVSPDSNILHKLFSVIEQFIQLRNSGSPQVNGSKRRRKRNANSADFRTETETEIERLFATKRDDVLARNRLLLEAAMQQRHLDEESDFLGDSGLVSPGTSSSFVRDTPEGIFSKLSDHSNVTSEPIESETRNFDNISKKETSLSLEQKSEASPLVAESKPSTVSPFDSESTPPQEIQKPCFLIGVDRPTSSNNLKETLKEVSSKLFDHLSVISKSQTENMDDIVRDGGCATPNQISESKSSSNHPLESKDDIQSVPLQENQKFHSKISVDDLVSPESLSEIPVDPPPELDDAGSRGSIVDVTEEDGKHSLDLEQEFRGFEPSDKTNTLLVCDSKVYFEENHSKTDVAEEVQKQVNSISKEVIEIINEDGIHSKSLATDAKSTNCLNLLDNDISSLEKPSDIVDKSTTDHMTPKKLLIVISEMNTPPLSNKDIKNTTKISPLARSLFTKEVERSPSLNLLSTPESPQKIIQRIGMDSDSDNIVLSPDFRMKNRRRITTDSENETTTEKIRERRKQRINRRRSSRLNRQRVSSESEQEFCNTPPRRNLRSRIMNKNTREDSSPQTSLKKTRRSPRLKFDSDKVKSREFVSDFSSDSSSSSNEDPTHTKVMKRSDKRLSQDKSTVENVNNNTPRTRARNFCLRSDDKKLNTSKEDSSAKSDTVCKQAENSVESSTSCHSLYPDTDRMRDKKSLDIAEEMEASIKRSRGLKHTNPSNVYQPNNNARKQPPDKNTMFDNRLRSVGRSDFQEFITRRTRSESKCEEDLELVNFGEDDCLTSRSNKKSPNRKDASNKSVADPDKDFNLKLKSSKSSYVIESAPEADSECREEKTVILDDSFKEKIISDAEREGDQTVNQPELLNVVCTPVVEKDNANNQSSCGKNIESVEKPSKTSERCEDKEKEHTKCIKSTGKESQMDLNQDVPNREYLAYLSDHDYCSNNETTSPQNSPTTKTILLSIKPTLTKKIDFNKVDDNVQGVVSSNKANNLQNKQHEESLPKHAGSIIAPTSGKADPPKVLKFKVLRHIRPLENIKDSLKVASGSQNRIQPGNSLVKSEKNDEHFKFNVLKSSKSADAELEQYLQGILKGKNLPESEVVTTKRKKHSDKKEKCSVMEDLFGDSPECDNTSGDALKSELSSSDESCRRQVEEKSVAKSLTNQDLFGDVSESDADTDSDCSSILIESAIHKKESKGTLKSNILKSRKKSKKARTERYENICKMPNISPKDRVKSGKIQIVQDIRISKEGVIVSSDQNKLEVKRRLDLSEVKEKILKQTQKKPRTEKCDTGTETDIVSKVLQDMIKSKPKSKAAQTKFNTVNNVNNQGNNSVSKVERLNNEAPRKNVDLDEYDCPRSPDMVETPDVDNLPKIIPVNKPKIMPASRIRMLFNKLMVYSKEENVLDEVVAEFATQDENYLAEIILQKVAQDYRDKPDNAHPHAPPLTSTQRVLLGFMAKLVRSSHRNIYDKFLETAEIHLFDKRKCQLRIVNPITRLYTAVCKLRKDMNRIRRFCCEGFYFMEDFAVPMFFVVLTMWAEVLPMENQRSEYPQAKVLVQLCYIKECSQPGYNLIPLRDLLHKFFGYPTERWSCDEVFQEVLVQYLTNPALRLSDFTLLLFLKNKPTKWVYQKLQENIMPVIETIPADNANLKATLMILLGNICHNFKKYEEYDWTVIKEMKEWFRKWDKDNIQPILKRSLYLAMSRLPCRPKNKPKTAANVKRTTASNEKSYVDLDAAPDDQEGKNDQKSRVCKRPKMSYKGVGNILLTDLEVSESK